LSSSIGDLALVLLNGPHATDIRDLGRPTLAIWLKALVDKGVFVTLVLDCCFSASVYRLKYPAIRYLTYNDNVAHRFPLEDESPGSLDGTNINSKGRNASTMPSWFINPQGYAILAACGPHEEAREIETEDGQPHGALSYLMLKTVSSHGLHERIQDIYNHLCAIFRTSKIRQSPVLYGNKE
jgi:hypothetical protein